MNLSCKNLETCTTVSINRKTAQYETTMPARISPTDQAEKGKLIIENKPQGLGCVAQMGRPPKKELLEEEP